MYSTKKLLEVVIFTWVLCCVAVVTVVGQSDFRALVESGKPLADKTLFIKEVMSYDSLGLLITRPRGFGKTLSLSMLNHFLNNNETNKELFKNFKISKEKAFVNENMNNHPTILISFQSIGKMTEKGALKGWRAEITKLYSKFNYIKDNITDPTDKKRFERNTAGSATDIEAKSALADLCKHLFNFYGKRVVLLIDDYDVPVMYGFEFNFYEPSIDFVKSILRPVYDYVEKVVLTGTTDIALRMMHDAAKNIRGFSIMDKQFSSFFCFTHAEVNKMLSHQKLTGGVNVTALEKWHGGYLIGDLKMLRPKSIYECLYTSGKIYLYTCEEPHAFRNFMNKHGILPAIDFEVMIMGINITMQMLTNWDYQDVTSHWKSYYAYLVHAGYLRVNDSDRALKEVDISIPNIETRLTFKDILRFYPEEYNVPTYREFISDFEKNDSAKVSATLNKYVRSATNFRNIKHNFLSTYGTLFSKYFKGLEKTHGKSMASEFEDKFIIRFQSDDDKSLLFVVYNEPKEMTEWDERKKISELKKILQNVEKNCEELIEFQKKHHPKTKVFVTIGEHVSVYFV